MKINKSQKKFIKANYKYLTAKEPAEKTGLTEKEINDHFKKEGMREKLAALDVGNIFKPTSISEIRDFLIENFGTILLLTITTFLVFANSLLGQFVSDDIGGDRDHPSVREPILSPNNFYSQMIFYRIMFRIFNLDPVPLHLSSLLIHIAAVILTFILISAIFGKRIGVISSLLFATHPVNSEAVAWISSLNYLINGAVFGITSLLYILYRNSLNKKYLLFSLGFFSFSVFFTTIPWIITIPPLLLIIDQFFLEKKFSFKKVLTISLFVIPIALFWVLKAGWISDRVIQVKSSRENPYSNTPYIAGAAYTVEKSLELLVFPRDLTLYHEGEIIEKTYLYFMYFVTGSLLFLSVILVRKGRKVSGLILFFIVSLGPALSPIHVAWYAAERYIYIGSIAFTALLAMIFLKLEEISGRRNTALILTGILVFAYSVRTIMRNAEWQTPKKLWLATDRVSPRSPKVHNNLGDIYSQEGNLQKSAEEFSKAILLSPEYTDAIHNLGVTYIKAQRYDLAKQALLRVLQIDPYMAPAWVKLGALEFGEGNNDKAIEYFENALKADPNNKDAKKLLERILTPKLQ